MNSAGEDENSAIEEEYYREQGGNNSATFYDFYVSLESSKGLLLGQHVTCEIDYGQMEAKEGIGLSSGWFVQDEEGNLFVWVASKEGGSLEKRKITGAEYNEMLDMYTIEEGLKDNEYIAWPGPDCVEGAKTTTKKVVKDEQAETEDPDSMTDEGMEGMEGEDSMVMEGGDMEGEVQEDAEVAEDGGDN